MVTKNDCLKAYSDFKQKGHSIRDTDDPIILAGAYLAHTQSNIKRAIQVVQVHVSGEYLDLPRFEGDIETLNLLKKLQAEVYIGEPNTGWRG